MEKIIFLVIIICVVLNSSYLLAQLNKSEKITEQYEFILEQSKLLEDNLIYQEIRKDFNRTFKYWLDTLKIEYIQYLRNKNYQLDEIVLFNKNQTKALLFLLQNSKGFNSVVEYVAVIAAKKLSKEWRFYYPVVTFAYGYPPERNTQYTFDELSRASIHTIVLDGYLKPGTLKINYDYIDHKWFSDDLDDYYEKFLRN